MKLKDDVKVIQQALAPAAEFGSFLAGYRAAEHRCFDRTQVWAIACCAFVLGMAAMGILR